MTSSDLPLSLEQAAAKWVPAPPTVLPDGTPIFQAHEQPDGKATIAVPGVIIGHRVETGHLADYVIYQGEFTEADGCRYREGVVIDPHLTAEAAIQACDTFSAWMAKWVIDNPPENFK